MNTAATTDIKCVVCGNDTPQNFKEKYDKESFAIYECNDCNFVFVPPYYRKQIAYDNYKDESVRKQIQAGNNWLKIQRHMLRIDLIKRFKPTGKLFDLGAGWGHFMLAAKEGGYDIYGIEISKQNYEYARNELNLPVDNLDFFKMPEEEKFDIITLWDVLEHIDAADTVVEKCNKLLAKDGYLFIQVPQEDSLFARMFKGNWGMMTIDHVNYFSRPTITKLLESHNFKVESIKSSLELKNVLVYYILPKLKRKTTHQIHASERQEYFNKVTKKRPMWMMKLFVGVHNLIYKMLSFFRVGEEMIVVARKTN